MANQRNDKEARRREQDRLRRERLAAEREAERRRTLRKRVLGVGSGLLVAAVIAGIVAVAGSNKGSGGAQVSGPAAPVQDVSGIPAPITANLRQGNQVIDDSLQTKLTELRGVPVVVNQWASWCPNCKAEFGFFQQLSQRYRTKVAFLGVDAQDTKANARAFLQQHPVNYPSVFDQNASQAQGIGAGQAWPTTLYFDSAGRETFVRPGGYVTLESLDNDIRRYALGQ